MVSQPLSNLSAVRRQHLLVEFSGLKHACPHGVYMSLTPGDPTLWSGVIFVRKGPYAPSILRFQISFPPTYPSLPPLVTFSTDIFHPLITPLTTYMYTTDIQDSGTVSATDEERLPPGGFSLRHGFPGWFGRKSRRSGAGSIGRNFSGGSLQSQSQTPAKGSEVGSPGSGTSGGVGLGIMSGSTTSGKGSQKPDISTYEVLHYIRSTFDSEEILDKVPLEAAGNPGAWHAWRTHQVKSGKISQTDGSSDDKPGALSIGAGAPSTARKPGDWNWDGVWEVRVKKGVDISLSEAVLFGKDAGDDLIRFLNLDEGQMEAVREDIRKSLEVGVGSQRRGVV